MIIQREGTAAYFVDEQGRGLIRYSLLPEGAMEEGMERTREREREIELEIRGGVIGHKLLDRARNRERD